MKNIIRLIVVVSCLFTTTNHLHAQWVQTSGPSGGGANCFFAVGGTDLFAGTWEGISRSSDSGASWTAVDIYLADTGICAFAAMGTNLFAGGWGGN